MLKAQKEKLEDLLVQFLSEKADTAEALFEKLKRQKRPYTLQALYKELRKLQQQGVVVKGRGIYSLRLSWILNLTDLADRAYLIYVDSPFPNELLPKGEKRVRWAFTNMMRADDFYMQVLTKLLLAPSSGNAFTAMEHPWFLFLNTPNELDYQRIMRQQRKKQLIVLENDTPLDRAQSRIYDNVSVKCAYSNDSQLCTTYTVITAVGEFILSEKLPSPARKGFSDIYNKTRSIKDLDFKTIRAVCNSPGASAVVLEHNPEKSKRLIKKLSEYF